jgi:hypothetical protein
MTAQPKTYLGQAIEDGHAEITGDGKTQRIHYIDADHSERWSDPEEKVRAEFWAEPIYKYPVSSRAHPFRSQGTAPHAQRPGRCSHLRS